MKADEEIDLTQTSANSVEPSRKDAEKCGSLLCASAPPREIRHFAFSSSGWARKATIAVILSLMPAMPFTTAQVPPPPPNASPAPVPEFVPALSTLLDESHLTALQNDLSQKNYATAVLRLQSMLQDHLDEFVAADAGGIVSFGTFVGNLPADQREALTTLYRQNYDKTAGDALDIAEHNPERRPADLYAVARHYPQSSAATTAYEDAGELALRQGDLAAADAMFQLALRNGWTPDPAHAQQIDALRQWKDGAGAHFLNGAAAAPPPQAVPAGQKAPRAPAYIGPVSPAAPWYDNSEIEAAHSFPLALGDRMLLIGGQQMIAAGLDGQLQWSAAGAQPVGLGGIELPHAVQMLESKPPGGAAARPFVDDLPAPMPALDSAAVLCDAAGEPQVIIARQQIDRDAIFGQEQRQGLRAVRASDGQMLWSTDAMDAYRNCRFASTPAVAGRSTYVVAIEHETGTDTATPLLLSIDTLTGQLNWQLQLGVFTDARLPRLAGMGFPHCWHVMWEESEPLVRGDVVYLAPSVGYVIAVGRFDGHIRWARPYNLSAAATLRVAPLDQHGFQEWQRGQAPWRRLREIQQNAEHSAKERAAGERAPRANLLENAQYQAAIRLLRAPTLRFRCTPVLCGDVLIAAPRDTDAVLGLNAATGKQLWSTMAVNAAMPADRQAAGMPPVIVPGSLIGQTQTLAIFATPHPAGAEGDSANQQICGINALDARDGHVAWHWSPPPGVIIDGPPVVWHNLVLFPASIPEGVIALSAATGNPANVPPAYDKIVQLWKTEAFHHLSMEAGLSGSFTTGRP